MTCTVTVFIKKKILKKMDFHTKFHILLYIYNLKAFLRRFPSNFQKRLKTLSNAKSKFCLIGLILNFFVDLDSFEIHSKHFSEKPYELPKISTLTKSLRRFFFFFTKYRLPSGTSPLLPSQKKKIKESLGC